MEGAILVSPNLKSAQVPSLVSLPFLKIVITVVIVVTFVIIKCRVQYTIKMQSPLVKNYQEFQDKDSKGAFLSKGL